MWTHPGMYRYGRAAVSYTHLDVYKRQIIVLLLSLVLIAWEVADFIPVPQIANVKAKLQAIPYFEFILLGVIFVFVLIATIRHGYAHSDGTTVNFREYGIKVGISAGVIFAYLGAVSYTHLDVYKRQVV